jgi:hypothetical protein
MAKKETRKKNTGFYKNLILNYNLRLAAAAAENKSPGTRFPAIFLFKIRLMIQALVSLHQDSGLQNPYPRNPGKKFEFCRLTRHWFDPAQQPTPASRIPDILSGAHPLARPRKFQYTECCA